MYDYIILLCSDKKGADGNFPDFRNGDYIGGDNKMNSFVKFAKKHPGATCIISGGFDLYCDNSEKIDDMVGFLREKLPKIDLIEIPSLSCVRHNLIAIFNKMGDELVGKKIAVFQNFIYIPRTIAIYSKVVEEEFPDIPIPQMICSESYLDNSESVMKNIEKFTHKLRREERGLYDLEEGNYSDYCLDKKQECFIDVVKKYPYLTSKIEKEKLGLLQETLK